VQPRAIIGGVTEPVPADHLRISDAERAAVADRLRRAHDEGRLDLIEFDERVQAVWAARTRGELARVAADLPAPAPEPRRPGVFSATPGGTAMRVLTTVWLGMLAVNLAIWGVLTLTLDVPIYPWWLWVGVPSGTVLAVLYATGIGRPRR
jgi:hypothetical protein